jgi:hypothetical protein
MWFTRCSSGEKDCQREAGLQKKKILLSSRQPHILSERSDFSVSGNKKQQAEGIRLIFTSPVSSVHITSKPIDR